MKRYALLTSIAAIGGTVAFQGSVNLQATTPGTLQVGHSNISGTSKAGQFVANSTVPTGQVIAGDFRTASPNGRAILGNASATTGPNFGGLFQTFSAQGRAVGGIAAATNGTNFGGFFTSDSIIGNGIFGQARATTGVNFGVKGKAVSPDGFGVYSEGNMHAEGIISGNGSGLTALNATNLATGNVADARLSGNVGLLNSLNAWTGQNNFSNPANTFFGNGFQLTGLSASNLASGTLADARLSSNVPLKNAANTFTALNIFSSPVLLSNGSSLVPALSFLNDPNTGLFKEGSGVLGFTTNGSERMRIDDNGVGIGTTSPTAKLDVRGDIRLGPTGEFDAVASEGGENLRIIRGRTNNLTATHGTGWTIARTAGEAIGDYTITFTTPFADIPVVTATSGAVTAPEVVVIASVSTSIVRIINFNVAGAKLDTGFTFIAAGPR